MKVLAAFLGVMSVAGAGWGVNAYVEARVDAVEIKIARVDEKAKGYSDAAYAAARRQHSVDFWRGEVAGLERELEHLRDRNAPGHKIRAVESELEYARSELRQALKALSDG